MTLFAAAAPLLAAAEPGPHEGGARRPVERASAADSLVDDYLRSLSDSTDVFFGASAAPPDTSGLDSTLTSFLDHPGSIPPVSSRRPYSLLPFYRFNRVDASVWGAKATLGEAGTRGRMEGKMAYAAGPNQWLGSARYVKAMTRGAERWRAELGWQRETDRFDPDHSPRTLLGERALLNGTDFSHYLRREGGWVELRRDGVRTSLLAGYRDQREGPLSVTGLWNLLSRTPVAVDNRAAHPGRARAFRYGAGAAVGSWPLRLWLEHETSSRSVNSDFEYRRHRAVAGTIVPLAAWTQTVLQLEYGRLGIEPSPQAAFLMGGMHSLRSLRGASLSGTRMGLGRVELILVPDLLQGWPGPCPDFLNLQLAGTAAAGAVWGRDPFGGDELGGGLGPERNDWRSEAGVALLYRPGLPDPEKYLRFDVAWPVGSHRGGPRVCLSYMRLLDLVPAIGR